MSAPPQSPWPVRRRGLDAARTIARDLGLGDVAPEVLSDRGSLMLRLPGTGVVARVSTHTAWQRRRPEEWLHREVTTGRIAAAAGAPVVAPAHADPGPHEVDGLWVTLWTDVGDQPERAGPEEAAAALLAWHRTLAGKGGELPVMPIVRELVTEPLDRALDHGVIDAATRAVLAREHEAALSAVEGLGGPPVLLHGDAHRGNLLRDQQGTWRWTDLEESCRGPLLWDLTVLAGQPTPAYGEAALTAYCRMAGRPVPAPEELAPWRRLRRLEGAAWTIGCAVTFPERYAGPAQDCVQQIVHDR
ncbi:MAG: aminoglycoside phosphotransferase [Acidobacteria bacterium]|nr:MAG: aminoglycoside phosphotransferase [Acidobacteriota bacterium]